MNKGKILVTGGCGYIGAHTIVDLIENDYSVISIDNFSNGKEVMLSYINDIVDDCVMNYNVDLCDRVATEKIFSEHKDIVGIIHFAAFKSVPASVKEPIKYYNNNINSLLNILYFAEKYSIKNIVFSSSCSVYGNADELPVSELTPLKMPESPYAQTKVMGEQICRDFVKANNSNITVLRYFNPVGAHPSIKIGELNQHPENLVPIITQTAIGIRETMGVFGNDYDTRDGSCVRDYIHVSDIAHAHTLALDKLLHQDIHYDDINIYNLGTGEGVTVLELIRTFEKVSGVQLKYTIEGRRPGDVIKVYADNTKAKKELGWEVQYSIEDMMLSAWKWELHLKALNS